MAEFSVKSFALFMWQRVYEAYSQKDEKRLHCCEAASMFEVSVVQCMLYACLKNSDQPHLGIIHHNTIYDQLFAGDNKNQSYYASFEVVRFSK